MKVAVDIVIFTIQEGVLKMLLVKRLIPPFKDQLAIPGGFVLPEEGVDEAALRELREETGVADVYLEQLYSFGDPMRRWRPSSLAGRPIVREPSLVFLGTTSLYGSEPTQYTRLHMPCEEIGGFHGDDLRYRLLGQTQGFGTFQFSDETVDALQTALSQSKRGQRVNSIFGEGASPRMRKIREGLDLLKLPSDLLLRHGAPRLVYGVSLVRNLKRYLLGQDTKPEYLFPIEDVEWATQRISAWWAERWLARRIQNPCILEEIAQHRLTYPVRHGARVDIHEEGLLPFDSTGFISD